MSRNALLRATGGICGFHKIVFQHIAPKEGLRILGQLAARLTPGSVGILDLPVRYTGGRVRRILSAVRTCLPLREPVMPLQIYSLSRLQDILKGSGCEMRAALSQTAVFEKAIMIFRRIPDRLGSSTGSLTPMGDR
jgi:hypothetical protein